jgi:geranylgeranyl reductase
VLWCAGFLVLRPDCDFYSTGEGIYFAAKSGRMAGQAVVKAMAGGSKLPTERDLLDLYIKVYMRH